MTWYHAVGLIWISEFILACQQMTVAGAVVTYYFTRSVFVVNSVLKCGQQFVVKGAVSDESPELIH